MTFINEDIFLFLANSLDLHGNKALVKKLFSTYHDLSKIFLETSFPGFSYFEKERIDFIKSELKKLDLEKIRKTLTRKNVKFISYGHELYPEKLREITDPPFGLFYKGDISLLKKTSVAIVGTRNATKYGLSMTKKITEYLTSQGILITSGLASGIDAMAHETAIKTGFTIAVLGTGVDEVYPVSNEKLYENILEKESLIISEYPCSTTGMPWNFPQRNRIISALSDAVIVTEGDVQSGALITAKFAIKQNKFLFALPGQIDSPMSNGPNMLIKSHAAEMLTSSNEILEKLSNTTTQLTFDFVEKPQVELNLNNEEKTLYESLKKNPMTFDSLLSDIDLPQRDLIRLISILELKGYIEKNNEGKYLVTS